MHKPLLTQGQLRQGESMARHVSWRAGGAADQLYVPASVDDLAHFLATLPPDEPVYAVGLGSNLLVRDGGYRGTVIALHAVLGDYNVVPDAETESKLVYAQAGVSCPKVARYAAMHELAGAEFLATIPGTVGGALAMNAGCYGWETWQFVERVAVINRQGEIEERLPSDYTVGYRTVKRHGEYAGSNGEWFIGAWFRFPAASDPGCGGHASRQLIKVLLEKRIRTQPLNLPNAGSVFRNPEGDYAARLIESCGLKGWAMGGCRVSEKHANFIVNPGGEGTATDIERLIGEVQRLVFEQTGAWLEPEVRIIGEA